MLKKFDVLSRKKDFFIRNPGISASIFFLAAFSISIFFIWNFPYLGDPVLFVRNLSDGMLSTAELNIYAFMAFFFGLLLFITYVVVIPILVYFFLWRESAYVSFIDDVKNK